MQGASRAPRRPCHQRPGTTEAVHREPVPRMPGTTAAKPPGPAVQAQRRFGMVHRGARQSRQHNQRISHQRIRSEEQEGFVPLRTHRRRGAGPLWNRVKGSPCICFLVLFFLCMRSNEKKKKNACCLDCEKVVRTKKEIVNQRTLII